MPSTITLDRTQKAVRRFIRRAPLTFTDTLDPALTIGDWVRNFILSPPFAWRWNRAFVTPQTLVAGTQDYVINLPNFGWVEQAVLTDSIVSPVASYQLEVALNLSIESGNNLPTKIAAVLDDGNGNITFRITPPPDKAYTLNITYQNASPQFAGMNDTWAPIPNYLYYIYHEGFLAKAYEYFGDERFPTAAQLFVKQLVAANGGLTQSQINIFLQDALNTQRTAQNDMQTSQSATQGRNFQ